MSRDPMTDFERLARLAEGHARHLDQYSPEGFDGSDFRTIAAALRSLTALTAEVERLRPRQGSNGSTHWEGCWEARGHHDCAVGEIERLRSLTALPGEPAEGTCGLFHCPLDDARRLMPSLPWGEAPLRPGVEYVVDVKVHKLMPGQWPCIPNWHCDFVPRDPDTLAEQFDLIDSDEVPMLMWLSGPPFTEFRDGRQVLPRTWMEFTQLDEHRGVAASEHCWRTFVRIAPLTIVRAGLPRERIPAPPEERIRRHTQVYLDAETFRW